MKNKKYQLRGKSFDNTLAISGRVEADSKHFAICKSLLFCSGDVYFVSTASDGYDKFHTPIGYIWVKELD